MSEPSKIRRRRKQLRGDTESIIQLPGSGVYVHCKRISAWLFEAFEKNRVTGRPKPPIREAQAMGGIVEELEDLDDPTYQAELAEWNDDYAERGLLLALDHAEALSENKAQEERWIARLERYGIPDTPEQRLRCFAFGDPVLDPMSLMNEVMRLTTVTQEEVAKAAERFQSAVDGHESEGTGAAKDEPDV